MKKILFITIFPSPYRVDFFNELGKQKDINLSVVFLEDSSEQKHRSRDWFSENYKYFNAIFLKKRIYVTKKLYFCYDIFKVLQEPYDEIIFGGYTYLTMMFAMEYLKIRCIPFSIEGDGGFIKKDSFLKFTIKHHFVSSASKWYSSGKFTDNTIIHYGAKQDAIYDYPFSSLRKNDIDSWLNEEQVNNRKFLLRRKLGITEKKVILSVGQFIHRKGFDILLKAVTALPADFGVYIIGGKPTTDFLEYISSHNISNVHFSDFKKKNELKEYYLASDVFVLPTREDIWGLVINEALANGIPVVTTDKCIAGIELIENGKNGYIVPTENEILLAEAIKKVLSCNNFEMRNYALDKIKTYTIENMVKAHLKSIMGNNNEKN